MIGTYRVTFSIVSSSRPLSVSDGNDALAEAVSTIDAHCPVEVARQSGTASRYVRVVSVTFVAASPVEAEAIARDAAAAVSFAHDAVKVTEVGKRKGR